MTEDFQDAGPACRELALQHIATPLPPTLLSVCGANTHENAKGSIFDQPSSSQAPPALQVSDLEEELQL